MDFQPFLIELSLATSLTTIWEYQNAPTPARPYVSLRIQDIQQIGRDWEGPSAQDGKFDILGQREALLTAYINPDPHDDPRSSYFISQDIVRHFNRPSIRSSLFKQGYALRGGPLTANLVPYIDKAEWQPRTSIDFRLGYAEVYEDDLGIVDAVAGTVQVDEEPPFPFHWEV